MMMRFAIFLLLPVWSVAQTNEITLKQGLIISNSCTVKAQTYALQPDTSTFNQPTDISAIKGVITIEGDGTIVDFQNAVLQSGLVSARPDHFTGLAILVKGKNVTLKNAVVRGYKVAVLALQAENLRLENCDFSYNYRPRLYSTREREDFTDWLSYHHDEKDEWLRYGAAIYLKNCSGATVKGCRATGCQNALLMTGCEGGLIYNNSFHYNSGLGIGLYRSSRNKIMHNFLDWNVRGCSYGFYERGQDSAGILLYEQSSNNLIAFNSVTHSGDGLFLWAGQSTMDTGEGGCNDNLVYGNDFSFAPTNGVEVTFSRNIIQGNLIRQCNYGIWGGYSFDSKIMGNLIGQCKTGIAIEHGQNDTIARNLFMDDTTGINLWARESQPADWGYAQKRDVRSRDGVIDRNVFLNVRKPLKISNSQNMAVNGLNLFFDFEKILETPKPNEGLKFYRNDIYGTDAELEEVWKDPLLGPSKGINFSHTGDPENPYAALDIPLRELHEPDSLPDGIVAVLPDAFPHGKQFILVDQWGPFDFRRPIATIDTIAGNKYSLALIGPSGDWKITSMRGVKSVSAPKGTVPCSLIVERDPASDGFELHFDYLSPQAITSEFGDKIERGRPYAFDFKRFEKKLNWKVQFFNYEGDTPPASFEGLKPAASEQVDDLYFAWWGKPAEGVQEDKFATLSTCDFSMEPGSYTLSVTSDDGVRVYLDGKLVLDHWNVHEPAKDEVPVSLGGKHHLRVEHFEQGGFGCLGVQLGLGLDLD